MNIQDEVPESSSGPTHEKRSKTKFFEKCTSTRLWLWEYGRYLVCELWKTTDWIGTYITLTLFFLTQRSARSNAN